MKLSKYIAITCLAWLSALAMHAQEQLPGSWNVLNVNYHLNPAVSVFAEGQIRSLSFYSQFHYHEVKGGINYHVHPSLRLSIAAGDYDTYRESGNFMLPKNNDEFRIWPQVLMLQQIGGFKIEQRYRTEMRFTSTGYRNRFRYRLGVSYPFVKSKEGYYIWQAGASNELFFTDREPYFERNRSMLNLQYRINKSVSLQIGYIHQFDYKINDETGIDFLMLGLFLDLHKDFFNQSDFESKDN
ncbi:MAG: DUF2490 domain-containing protein [Bacteroidota bacterium]